MSIVIQFCTHSNNRFRLEYYSLKLDSSGNLIIMFITSSLFKKKENYDKFFIINKVHDLSIKICDRLMLNNV